MPHPDSEFKPDNEEWNVPHSEEDTSTILLRYARNKIIPELEKRYGQRHPCFHLNEIVFCGGPKIKYPGKYSEQGGYFHISLTPCCDRKPISYRAIFQLAHECLHVLKPVKRDAATVLEEGLATESSLVPNKKVFESWDLGCDYKKAYIAVKDLRRLIDLDKYIKKYREDNPGRGISDITCDDIRPALEPESQDSFDDLMRDVPLFSSFECWRKRVLCPSKS